MTRALRILRHTLSLLSLLLFILLLIFWRTSPTPRVIWWNHSDPLPHYHLATVRNFRLELGLYRETSLGSLSIQSLTQQLELTRQEISKQTKLLDHLSTTFNSRTATHSQQIAISQARGTYEALHVDMVRLRYRIAEQAPYALPPQPGLHTGLATRSHNSGIPTQRASPPCYASNLLSRFEPTPTEKKSRFLGLTLTRVSRPYQHWQTFTIPLWLLLPLLLILPSTSLLNFLKSRRRRKLNLCPSCGYDLRATPSRCPECGAIVHRENA
jgi:hypothetical protein